MTRQLSGTNFSYYLTPLQLHHHYCCSTPPVTPVGDGDYLHTITAENHLISSTLAEMLLFAHGGAAASLHPGTVNLIFEFLLIFLVLCDSFHSLF